MDVRQVAYLRMENNYESGGRIFKIMWNGWSECRGIKLSIRQRGNTYSDYYSIEHWLLCYVSLTRAIAAHDTRMSRRSMIEVRY